MRRYAEHWLKASVVKNMQALALVTMYRGTGSMADRITLDESTAVHVSSGSILIFTREEGYHSSGWWKNPDYERCYHLSLSFRDPESGEYAPQDHKLAEGWIDLFFGENKRLLWVEPPTEQGKQADVYHYRLFCDEKWQPIKPRGEVYSRELTEAGWKSFSDLKYEREVSQ